MNPALAARLRLGFAVMLVLLMGVTVVGVGRLFELRQDFEDETSRAFQLELAGERLRSSFVLEQAALNRLDDDRSSTRTTYERAALSARRTARAALELAPEGSAAAELIERRTAAEREWRRRVAGPLLRGRRSAARTEARLAREVVAADASLIERQQELREALRNAVRGDTRGAVVWIVVALGASFLAALLVFGGLVGSMRRPLDNLVRAARRLSTGDLASRAEIGGPAELAALGMTFNDMAQDLQETYRRIEDERSRLAAMIESLGDGLVTIDSHGTITLVNPAAARMLPDAAPGAGLAEALAWLGPDGATIERLVAGRQPEEMRIGDGKRVLSLTSAAVGTAGAGAVVSLRDISDATRLEQMKDEFVATVSHELRSPLTSIMGFAELLMLESERLTADQAENVRVIVESTDRLQTLVNDLLDLARSDAGRLTIHQQSCEVPALVDDAVSLIRPRVRAAGQRVQVRVEPGLPHLFADADRVKQVLGNLLTNAHLYTPAGGLIRVDARQVEKGIELSVADNGPGIPPEQQERLFERFWRGHAGESQQAGGSGLGLPIARSLVELHGGELTVDSAVGEGTTFRVVLPAVRASRLPGREALVGRRVLLVEGEAQVGRVLVRRMAEAGVEAETVRGADQALARLRDERFALAVIDLQSTGLAGFALIEELLAVPSRGVPAVAISIHPGREDRTGRRIASPLVEPEALIAALDASLAQGQSVIVAAGEPRLRAEVAATFAAHGRRPSLVETAEAALATAKSASFDLLLVEARLPGGAALKTAVDQGMIEGPPARVVVLEPRGDDGAPLASSLDDFVDRMARALAATAEEAAAG